MRALLSVWDKTGLIALAKGLEGLGWELVSSRGTSKALAEENIAHTKVEEVTGSPEMLGGRVKTLHPKIHGGILADLGDPDHVQQLVKEDIGPIDLVCINLYPFEETVADDVSEREAIEQIDIGGPAMLRAAAKNFRSVTVVPSSSFYEEVLNALEGEGQVVARYLDANPNGSLRDIAGVCNERGNVVGLMPHPEHAVEDLTGPGTDGLGFFTSLASAAFA